MLIMSVLTFALLSSPVLAAPGTTPTTDDDPLETSETGHFHRKGLWRKILKQLSGYGLGGLASNVLTPGGKHQHYPGQGYGYNYHPVGGYTGHNIGFGYTGHGEHYSSYPSYYGGSYGLHDVDSLTHGGGISSWDLLDGYGYGWGGFDHIHHGGSFL